MDSKKLEVLIRAVDTGSLTAAAAELGYTQSGITHMMNALENEVGFALLIRGRYGVIPTEECRVLLPHIRTLLTDDERLRQEIASISGVCSGTIRIGSNTSISMYWMPTIIARFEARFPQIRLEFFGGASDSMATLLNEGKADLCFLSRRPLNCDWIHLAYDPLMAILPPDHPMKTEKEYPVSAMDGQAYLRYSTLRNEDIAEVEELLKKEHIRPELKLVSNSDYAITSMVEQGLGISILPELILSGFPQKVVKLPLCPRTSRDLGIAVRSKKEASPAVRRFIECAEKTIRDGEVYLPGQEYKG